MISIKNLVNFVNEYLLWLSFINRVTLLSTNNKTDIPIFFLSAFNFLEKLLNMFKIKTDIFYTMDVSLL